MYEENFYQIPLNENIDNVKNGIKNAASWIYHKLQVPHYMKKAQKTESRIYWAKAADNERKAQDYKTAAQENFKSIFK